MGKIPTRPLINLTERHREMARRLVMGERQIDVARDMGINAPRLSDLTRSPVFASYVDELSRKRDRAIIDAVEYGAMMGVQYMLNVLTEGTPESLEADIKTKLKVSQDFLDREGSAPRHTAVRSTKYNANLNLTSEDIENIKAKAVVVRKQIAMNGQ